MSRAISGSSFGWVSGRRSADEAVDDALGNCTPGKGGECAIVNINDKPAE
jgi:hypothetical protein